MGNKSTTKLAPQAMADLTESTNFSEAEIRSWYRDFLKDFPSGEVTIEEFKGIYSRNFPNGDASGFSEHVFRTFDKDHDHNLDFREFLVAISVTSDKDPKERLIWAFHMYDLDENGYITKEECTEIIKSLSRLIGTRLNITSLHLPPDKRTDRIFEIMDTDKDGRISLDEFVQGAHADPGMVAILESRSNP